MGCCCSLQELNLDQFVIPEVSDVPSFLGKASVLLLLPMHFLY